MNRLRNSFIIGCYNTLRLCSIQLTTNAWKCLYMVTLNHNWFQNCYCKCLSGNFIISWWVTQKRAELRRQETQNIISPLVILHYDQFYHPNIRRYLHGTRSCVVVRAEYLPIVFINRYYHGVIVIWGSEKDTSQNLQNRRYGEKSNRLFDKYKNSVMPHGSHTYPTAPDMTMATMRAYPPSQHEFTHWKYVLRCCSNFPYIYLPDQE